jgi:hypothetical protein
MAIHHPSFGTIDTNRVIVFDTTLRDGEQSPGFSMNLDEKPGRFRECAVYRAALRQGWPGGLRTVPLRAR